MHLPVFQTRYCRVTKTVICRFPNGYQIETTPAVATVLTLYQQTQDISQTVQLYKNHYPTDSLTVTELTQYIEYLMSKITAYQCPDPATKPRTYKFPSLNPITPIFQCGQKYWALILLVSIVYIFFVYSQTSTLTLISHLFISRKWLYQKIVFLVVVFYFSRWLFTPIHELGHAFWYYCFTNQIPELYLTVPGIIRPSAFTTTSLTLFLPKAYQRVLVHLGGVWAELITLGLIINLWGQLLGTFVLSALTLRIGLSILFNLNILSTSTDGHQLLMDLVGFPTLYETFSDWLKTVLNPHHPMSLPLSPRVRSFLKVYFLLGLGLVGAIIILNVLFFSRLLSRLTVFITTSYQITSLDTVKGLVYLGLVLLTLVYYLDLLIRGLRYRKTLHSAYQFLQSRYNHKQPYSLS